MSTPPKHVTCRVSHVTCNFFFFLQCCEAYWWRVCYQRGLPRLVEHEMRRRLDNEIRSDQAECELSYLRSHGHWILSRSFPPYRLEITTYCKAGILVLFDIASDDVIKYVYKTLFHTCIYYNLKGIKKTHQNKATRSLCRFSCNTFAFLCFHRIGL